MATTSNPANMYIPSKIDMEYLIDAAEKTSGSPYIPRYLPYILFKEAQKTLENQARTDYTADLQDRIRKVLSRITDKGIPDFREDYKKKSAIKVLAFIYGRYSENIKVEQRKEDEKLLQKREDILRTSKAMRTALKLLSRVERGDTAEEDFIQENEIPEEFLQDTEYDVPISKSDIEYLIDAAEKIYIQQIYYISYMLYKEAEEMLEKLKNCQTFLIGLAENTEDLESRISSGLSLLMVLGTLKDPPGRYARKTTIGKLVLFYSEYKKNYQIDGLREEEKNHKKWGILSANFQESEGRTTLRETTFTTAKALRTALKALSLTSQEYIPEQFLQDTEYDKEGSSETYNIIPFDGPTNWLPDEVNDAIASLQLGIGAFPFATQGRDVLDCLQILFKFQESSVSNQRENIVNLLSNEQMRTPGEREPAFKEALENVFSKTLDNYKKWCRYLSIEQIWNSTDENAAGEGENAAGEDENAASEDENVISNEKKILYISLYYLIWGEAANVRFLPECLCYIFHQMSRQVDKYLRLIGGSVFVQVPQPALYEGSFIDEVIQPLYEVIAAEAQINNKRDVSHSKWRNYDDFNEYFWSPECFQLGWPLNKESTFFRMPSEGSTVFGKTSFVERRTFIHLYHSFHRMWIFHVIVFEALGIIALNDEKLNSITLREILIVGPTYFFMKLIQRCFDIVLKDGAYSNTNRADVSRIRFRIICFRALCLLSTLIIYFVGIFRKYLQEEISSVEESIAFYACIVVLVIYACTITWINQLEKWVVRRMDERLLDSYLKEEYVGRDMGEKKMDIFWYMIFWIVTLAINFAWTYYGLIKYLVPTIDITDVSKNIHNMLAIGSLWVGVICAYIVGSHVVYNVTSAVVGTYIVGRWNGLGEIKSLGDVRKCFGDIPKKIMDRLNREPENNQEDVKLIAEGFSRFWNQIVMHLREEDNISDLEQYALSMPKKSGCIHVIQWPPFLLVGKVSDAIKIAAKSVPQEVMWNEIKSDVYMKYAVEECFHSAEFILSHVLEGEGSDWVKGIYGSIRKSIEDRNLDSTFQLKKLESIIKEISELTEALEQESRLTDPTETLEQESRLREPTETLDHDRRRFEARRQLENKAKNAQRLKKGAKNAATKLYNVIQRDFLREREAERREFADFQWPINEHPELRSQIRRLHVLLNVKSADHVPRNREARRRLEFFTNSLFMSMPKTKPVREMLSFSVLTPYYEEAVLYTIPEILKSNDDGVTLIDYLKNLYPDEWSNYCERLGKRYIDNPEEEDLELRLWASYRGQTLARTVRGTMYYQKALLLQAHREMLIKEGLGEDALPRTSYVYVTMTSDSDDDLPRTSSVDLTRPSEYRRLNERFDKLNAHVDLKFTYVVTCQIYGKQKRERKQVAADIAFLLKRNEGLRVAFVDQVNDEFYSKLVKSTNGIETEVYSIKLPGDPILGEGKPENQNHAIVFTRGNAIQTIDMNQDNYFEETLKMRNLLEEFHREHAPTILGIREHIFTGSASSLASFMSNQETGFVTLGQRVLANPLKVRMHYGHPDVFDRVFHITRGGISKASRGINISEDIYAGFNSTLRQGSVTHHEYIQVGKGRDVGFNQIATFEGKVAGGNGEQVLSRDIYRLGQRFDFFRMLSFYYTTVGYYFSSLLMVITLYILLYGNLFMALSGKRVPHVLNDIDMAPEWFLMIVLLPAIYMLLVPFLEQGFEKAVESFLAMFFSLGSIFYAFSLGTRIHWFGRTIIHGGASYQATGRGFVLHHIKFSENFRRYSRSHFIKGMEVLFLVAVYIIYGFHSFRAFYNNLLLLGGSILSISWIVGPFLFDSSPFDLNKILEDWEDWNNWRNCKSVRVESRPVQEGAPVDETVPAQKSVPVDESWESWWNKELDHIRTPLGRVIETILSLRFFIFPLVVGYKIDVQELKNSLSNCVIPWICLVGILFAYEFFSFFLRKKLVIQFFSINRVATISALTFAIAYYYAFGYMLMFTIAIITIVWGFISGTIGPLVVVYYFSPFGDKLAIIIAIITTVWAFISFILNNRLATIGALAIAYYCSALGDTLALFIAIITFVWGFLSICVAWKEIISLWTPLMYLAWICDTGKEALSFNINGDDDLGMLLLYFLIYVSDECKAWKPTLERFNLRRPVRGFAWFCDTGMGALMFKIANMFSQRSIRRYLVRNMFDQNISELLHNSSADSAARYGAGF